MSKRNRLYPGRRKLPLRFSEKHGVFKINTYMTGPVRWHRVKARIRQKKSSWDKDARQGRTVSTGDACKVSKPLTVRPASA